MMTGQSGFSPMSRRRCAVQSRPDWKDVHRQRRMAETKARRFDSLLAYRSLGEGDETVYSPSSQQDQNGWLCSFTSTLSDCSSRLNSLQEDDEPMETSVAGSAELVRGEMFADSSQDVHSSALCERQRSMFEQENRLHEECCIKPQLSRPMESCHASAAMDGAGHRSFPLCEVDLCNALELLRAGEVICPICKCNPLQQTSSVVWCSCGLHIDTKQENISMDYVQYQLREAIDQHGLSCAGFPKFSLNSVPSLDLVNLVLHCEMCDFFYVVL